MADEHARRTPRSDGGSAYPALFIVPKAVEGDDGVHRTPDAPGEAEVTDVVNRALDDAGWRPADTVVDVRRGTRELQDEVPPADPIDVEGVTVVFSQSPAPEAEGWDWEGPYSVAKKALGDEFEAEIWIDAVVR